MLLLKLTGCLASGNWEWGPYAILRFDSLLRNLSTPANYSGKAVIITLCYLAVFDVFDLRCFLWYFFSMVDEYF